MAGSHGTLAKGAYCLRVEKNLFLMHRRFLIPLVTPFKIKEGVSGQFVPSGGLRELQLAPLTLLRLELQADPISVSSLCFVADSSMFRAVWGSNLNSAS